MNLINLNIDGIDKSREAVRKTGNAFLIVGVFVGLLVFLFKSHAAGWMEWNWQNGMQSHVWRWFAGVGGVMFLGTRMAYPVFKSLHTAWMTLALVLGWISSHLLLTIYFYLVILPIGLTMKLFGKDLLDQKIDPKKESYWIKREQKPIQKSDFERLF